MKNKYLLNIELAVIALIGLNASQVFAHPYLCRYYGSDDNGHFHTGMTAINPDIPEESKNGELNLYYLPDVQHDELMRQCQVALEARFGGLVRDQEVVIEPYRNPQSPLGLLGAAKALVAKVSTNVLGADITLSDPVFTESQIRGALVLKAGGLADDRRDPDSAFDADATTLNKMSMLSFKDNKDYWFYRISLRHVYFTTDYPGTTKHYFDAIELPNRLAGEGQLVLGALPVISKVDPDRNYASKLLALVESPEKLAILSLVQAFEIQAEGWLVKAISKRLWAERGAQQLHIETPDFLPVNVAKLHIAADYIDAQIRQGNTIYVHCKAGRGRSAMAVIAYLCKYRNMSMDEAIPYVKSFRAQVNMNPQQLAGLRDFAASLTSAGGAGGGGDK